MTARSFFRSPLKVILFFILILLALLWLVPVITSVVTSVRTNDDILSRGFWALPKQLVFSNFKTAWQRGGLSKFLPNSFIITSPSRVPTRFLSSLSAYALARFKFRANRLIYFLFVGGMMLPFQVLLLPVFRLTDFLGLYDTYWGLIAFHTAFQMGFCTFVLRNYMITVPIEIFEAAKIDGCNAFRIWWQIMMPLTVPALAAIATLEFTWIFNDYLLAIVLVRSEEHMPVTAGLASLQGQFIMDWTVIVSGALLAAVPTIIVFIFLQRYFIEGLTLGSSK